MHVARLVLHDFRSYTEAEIDLEPGPIAFIGANGQGKTNLVEAIDYVSRLDSHRVAGDAPLVRVGADQAVVRVEVRRADRTALLEVEITPGRANRARVNGSALPRTRDVVGILRTVMFSPDDLALVKGDPSDRRHFLDALLTLRTPRLGGVKADYDRVLKQRNALLKSARGRHGSVDLSTLDIWDDKLATLGAELVAATTARCWPTSRRIWRRRTWRSRPRRPPTAVTSAPPTRHPSSCPTTRSAIRHRCARRCWPASSSADATSSNAASASSGRTATKPCSRSATSRPRGTRVTVSRGHSRWRCGWRRSRSCGRRATTRC